MSEISIRDVQDKILEVMLYIDKICRKNDITYFIMGGTALGAVRHAGFIPWDDDLDIFMTPKEYEKFKHVFHKECNEKYVLQEWKTVPNYLEYAKVRMNGTTFIEKSFKDCKDMHQGIYVDIMMLHKCPNIKWKQKSIYYQSKFVTLYALTQRNWKPKNNKQAAVVKLLNILPKKKIANWCYKNIYRYDDMNTGFCWCYFITPAKFKQGIFEKSLFQDPVDIEFENHHLLGSKKIKEYLASRYGDYMKLPSKEQQEASVHAYIYDTEKDYRCYINDNENYE